MGFDFKRFALGVAALSLAPFTGGASLSIGALTITAASVLVAVGAGLALSAFTPSAPKGRQDGVLASGVDPENALPIVYGTVRVGPWIVFMDSRDTSRGPNTRVDLVAAFCLGNRVPADVSSDTGEVADPFGGEVEGFGSVFFDDRQAFDENGATADFTTQGSFRGHPLPGAPVADLFRHSGSHTETADAYMIETAALTGDVAWRDDDSTWTSAHQGQGVVYGVFAIRLPDQAVTGSENKAIQRILPGGIPQITAMIRGRRVYDPRVDDWVDTQNAALCVRDFLLDDKVGCRLSLNQIDDESFKAEANIAEDFVLNPISIINQRYNINGAVDTSRPAMDNLREMMDTAGYILPYEQGKYRLKRLDPDTAVHELKINESIIIGDWSFETGEPSERVNRLIVKYVDGSNFDATDIADRVATVEVPQIGTTNTYLAADDDLEIPREINLPFVNNQGAAYSRGLEELTKARNDLQLSVTCTEEAMQFSVGDRVLFSHRDFSMVDKEFWVVGMGLNPDETVTLALREILRGQGSSGFSGGSSSPVLTFGSYCTVEHGALQDPPVGTSTAASGASIFWSEPPPEDDTHEDFIIQIRAGTCENFDPINSSPAGGFDCGLDSGTALDHDADDAQPHEHDYTGTGTGNACSSVRCGSDTEDVRYYKARWGWTNPVTAGQEFGPWSSAYTGPTVQSLESHPDYAGDPNGYCTS